MGIMLKDKNKITNFIEKTIKIFEKIPIPLSKYRIAITGLSRSGKSVFLTSLINQLLAKDKLNFKNKKTYTVKLIDIDLPITKFPYFEYLEEFRKTFASWPKSTTGVSGFALEIEIQSGYSFIENKRIILEFIDYPGEWLIDLPMQNRSYAEWSNRMISFALKEDKKDFSLYWIKSINSLLLDENTIVERYRWYLQRLKTNDFSFIQAGHFLQQGSISDEVINFAPLMPKDKSKKTYKKFEKRYNNFIKEMKKAFDKPYYKDYDKQIILVDLIKSLQSGYDAFEDMHLAIDEMLSPYSYGNNNFLSKLFLRRISQVIIVGTKADNIANNQHNNYKELLNDMLKEIKERLKIKHIRVDSTIIASVKSTQNVKIKHQGRELSCLKGIVEGEQKPSIHWVGEIPEDFYERESWRDREFAFPNFKPSQFPTTPNRAVEHIRMDRLIEMLIGEWL